MTFDDFCSNLETLVLEQKISREMSWILQEFYCGLSEFFSNKLPVPYVEASADGAVLVWENAIEHFELTINRRGVMEKAFHRNTKEVTAKSFEIEERQDIYSWLRSFI